MFVQRVLATGSGVRHAARMKLCSILIAAMGFLLASSAAAQDERSDELLHADQPLWSTGSDQVWPQHFTDEESFGCAHRIKLGLWRYDAAAGQSDDPTWFSFRNYGVFHCWMNVAEGPERNQMGSSRPGFLIDLRASAEGKELWALQLGARPGSEYLLLARNRETGAIKSFEVLQRDCPAGYARGGASLDILITRYCSLSSRGDLIALAKRMAKRPALGTMTFVEPEPDQ